MAENFAEQFIIPNWPVPANVRALSTTRLPGFSAGDYASNNLALHVGDDAEIVKKNRQKLQADAKLSGELLWLNQVHSNRILHADDVTDAPNADASYTDKHGQVCVVMTADCLPVLLTNENGTMVAAVHAGWRGLLDGILENAASVLSPQGESILAWLGPAIGETAFEVGEDVVSAFVKKNSDAEAAFLPIEGEEKWLANIYKLAEQRLNSVGVVNVYGGEFCTYGDEKRFFSYRRDGVCGRMASLIWLDK